MIPGQNLNNFYGQQGVQPTGGYDYSQSQDYYAYYAQLQQYYAMLWQQYYARQQQLYGENYRPPQIQQSPQPEYTHGGIPESIPSVPANLKHNGQEVFISYSTKNPHEAVSVCRALENAGIRCWIAPRDLLPGSNFAENIETALNNARVLLLILSEASATSPWVEGEINAAFSSGMPIFVYRIDNVEVRGSMKVMLEKFPMLYASGNQQEDLETLIYNAEILTGRVEAPCGYNATGAAPAVAQKTPQSTPVQPAPPVQSQPRTNHDEPQAEPPVQKRVPEPAAAPAQPAPQPQSSPQPLPAPAQPSGINKYTLFFALFSFFLLLALIVLTARYWFQYLPPALRGE